MIFKIADENGLLLLDLKDLRSMLQYVADNADQFKTQYGNIATPVLVRFSAISSRSNHSAAANFSVSPRSISMI